VKPNYLDTNLFLNQNLFAASNAIAEPKDVCTHSVIQEHFYHYTYHYIYIIIIYIIIYIIYYCGLVDNYLSRFVKVFWHIMFIFVVAKKNSV
jgi:hypothetical protein